MNQKQIGVLLMVLSAVTFSMAIILMKVIPELTPMKPEHVAVWRFTLAAPIFGIITMVDPNRTIYLPNRLWPFLGLGLVFSVASFCAVFALARLPSSIFVIIINISPSLVVLVALLSGRPVPKLFWLGLPLTMVGLVLTVYEFDSKLVVDLEGLLITLLNAVAFGSYMILSELVFYEVKDRILGTQWMLMGAMMAGLIMIPFVGISTPNTPRGWMLLLSLGIFGTVVPLLTMNISLQLLGAARGSVITTLQPVLTVLFSTIFLNETLAAQQWIGGALVVVAVVLLQRSPDRFGKRGNQALHRNP
jgi:drug/metabolite transporter (DMT)-like permease